MWKGAMRNNNVNLKTKAFLNSIKAVANGLSFQPLLVRAALSLKTRFFLCPNYFSEYYNIIHVLLALKDVTP